MRGDQDSRLPDHSVPATMTALQPAAPALALRAKAGRVGWTILVIALAMAAPAAQQDNRRLLDDAEAALTKYDAKRAGPMFAQALASAREAANDAEIARATFG